MTDQEKDSVDADCKSLLRNLTASLTQLASAESVRRETAARVLDKKYSKGFLGKWAAGNGIAERSLEQIVEEGRLETIKVVRESVVWFLQKRLEDAGDAQRRMMERRLEREIEKGRSVLYKTRGQGSTTTKTPGWVDGDLSGDGPGGRSKGGLSEKGAALESEQETRTEIERQLSPDQLQLFAKENQDMLKQYEDSLDQVR